MSDFSNTLTFTVIKTEKHSFTSSDGKEIEYVDSLILSDSGKLYIVRDKVANEGWQSGEDRTENLFQNGKVTPLKVPVLKIDRES